MAPVQFFWSLLWSPLAAGLAALYLAVEGLVAEKHRSGAGIVAAAVFLAVSSAVNFFREQTLARKMTKTSVRINQRLTSLIGSLGEISGDNYHCWKVDLYTAHWRLRWSSRFPWVAAKVLVRQASVSIQSSLALHDTRRLLEEGPVGRSYSQQRQQLWLGVDAAKATPTGATLVPSSDLQRQLQDECGAMRTAPVVSHLDGDCIGVLSVHVEPSFGARLGGTLATEDCARRLRSAAVELHQIIRG